MNLQKITSGIDKLFKEDDGSSYVKVYEGEETHIAAACYFPFVSAAILLIRKDNSEFVSFHARQALALLIVGLLLMVILPGLIKVMISLALFVLLAYGAYKAVIGRKWYLPAITEFAQTIQF